MPLLKVQNEIILKNIIALNFKLGQLIENNVIQKVVILCSNYYCPLQIWPLKTCNQDISKIIIAWSFKLDQLIEDGESLS